MDRNHSFLDSTIPPERIPINQLARSLEVNLSTLYRWRNEGVRGHRLATITIGSRVFVTREALEEFITATNARPAPAPAPAAPRLRRRQIDAAGREVASAGVPLRAKSPS